MTLDSDPVMRVGTSMRPVPLFINPPPGRRVRFFAAIRA
jgi:hypothetical protein